MLWASVLSLCVIFLFFFLMIRRPPRSPLFPSTTLFRSVVTAALVYWTLHDVDPRAVLGHIRRAHPFLLIAAVATATLTFPLRTARWRLILRDVDGHRFPWLPLWHATAVGFMANNLLPVRAGEVARAYVARRQLPVRFMTALASIGVERGLDGLVMVGLLALALAAPSFPGHAMLGGTSLASVATGAAALFAGVLVAALAVAHRPARWLSLGSRLAHRVLPPALADRLTHLAGGVVAGLAVLKHPSRFALVVGWSLVLWLVNAASFALCFRAFDLPLAPDAALLLQGVIGFRVALPSSPRFFGPFEGATAGTPPLHGIGAQQAGGDAGADH